MSKIQVGDIVYVSYMRKEGTVIACRGGYVGRWQIETDSGEKFYASSRDCVVIKPCKPIYATEMTTEEKLDTLLDYLGLEIERKTKIRVVKKAKS
jgi:hypothetical protein